MTVVDTCVYNRGIATHKKMEHDYSQGIEKVLKEYQAEGLTREEAIKRFCKENNKQKRRLSK